MAEELKPCPFCGSRAAQTSIEGTSWVECVNPNCEATTWGDASSWNTRAETPELRAIRKAIEFIVSSRVNATCGDIRVGLFQAQNIIIEQLLKEGVAL